MDEAAKDSSSSLKETSALLEKSQTALGKFYKQFSNGLTGGEVFLDEVSSSASKSLNKFEIKADKANLAVGDSLDTITQINEKNAQLLKDLEKLNQNLGKDTQLSASVGQEISQLQTQSISAQTGKFIEKCKYQYAESVKEFQRYEKFTGNACRG